MFTFNGRNFEGEKAFPPINDEIIPNAVMVAPYEGKMYVWEWGMYSVMGKDEHEWTDIWKWKPMYPFEEKNLLDFLLQIQQIKHEVEDEVED